MSVQSSSRKPEVKLVDVTQTSSIFDTTATRVTCLNATSQGAAETNRIGRKIVLKSVMIRGYINQYQAGAAPINDFLRAILVYDRQPNGAAPVFSDIIQDVDQAGTTSSTSMSSLNISNSDRFKVLRDWFWKVDVPGGATLVQAAQVSTDCKEFSLKAYVPLNGLETHYNGTNGGTIADITSGSLLLVTQGGASAANSQYRLTFVTRVRFTDA